MATTATHLEKEIGELRMSILEMGSLTEKALDNALRSAAERDVDLAETVIESDCNINEIQYRIDEYCLKLLALEQPVARDLRYILGATHVAANLERIGDQAVNISERVILLAQRPAMPHNPMLDDLFDTAATMFRTVIDAFNREDADAARKVCEMDAKADTLNLKILKQSIDYMIQESRAVERAVHQIIVARSLERIGDLSTNIAENIIFIMQGVDIRQICHPY